MNNKPSPSNKQFFVKFASLGSQLLAALAIAVFAGLKLDKWIHTLPLFSIALPLLTLIAIFYKIMRETFKSKNEK
jgi:F0F1-type ATP synthase assembly protein I